MLVVREIYKKFISPMKSIDDYHDRAYNYEFYFRNKKKAIEILKQAFNLKSINEIEKAGIFIRIAFLYYELKNYKVATQYFDQAFKILLKEKIYYVKDFNSIIKCYVYANQKQKALDLYNNLLERQSYDSRFKKLKKIEEWLEKY